jgi:CO/xanthine dehydrogenase Mo-binding subunit
VDARVKVTGEAKYFADIQLPGMLVGKILTSPHPHARILSIDTSKAEQLPGVRAVVTAKDMPEQSLDFYQSGESDQMKGLGRADLYALVSDKVHFVGEEIAAVAADTPFIAEEALRLIEVKYEVLPGVFDPEESMNPGAPQIYDDIPDNVPNRLVGSHGDVEKGFQEADHIFEDEYRTQPQYHGALERHGCICRWDQDGTLTMWTTTQTPHLLQWMYSGVTGTLMSKVRIVSSYIGGGFGSKTHVLYPYHLICSMLSKKAGRPVKVDLSRMEDFAHACACPPWIIKLKTGVKNDGRITAKHLNMIGDCGAHLYSSAGQLNQCVNMAFSHLYKVSAISYEGWVVYTNNPHRAVAYRGFGNPQISFAMESQMDRIAEKLGIDPAELRLKNLFEPGETSQFGWKFDAYGLPECIKKAAQATEWKTKRSQKVPNRGIGMASILHMTGWKGVFGAGESDSTIIVGKEDGSFCLYTDFSEIGTGVWTVACAVTAEILGVALDKIKVVGGDTEVTPFGQGSYASRGTYNCGNSVKLAALDMKRQILEAAADLLDENPDDLGTENDEVFVKETPEKRIPFGKVCWHVHFNMAKMLISKGAWTMPAGLHDPVTNTWGRPGPMTSYSFACQVAEVEVDPRTGKVNVLKVTAAHDIGYPINLDQLEGQIEGGVVMGLGYALTENLKMEEGRVLVDDFADYFVRRSQDIPEIDPILIITNDAYGPFGAKGIGEAVMCPTAAAIANAVYDAVGVRITELPITQDRILRALKEKR